MPSDESLRAHIAEDRRVAIASVAKITLAFGTVGSIIGSAQYVVDLPVESLADSQARRAAAAGRSAAQRFKHFSQAARVALRGAAVGGISNSLGIQVVCISTGLGPADLPLGIRLR